MSLFDKLKLKNLSQVISDSSYNKRKKNRNKIVHFCEHDGISIRFTRAKSAWHALVPSALKPWWLSLQPIRNKTEENVGQSKQTQQQENKITTKNATENAAKLEETENA